MEPLHEGRVRVRFRAAGDGSFTKERNIRYRDVAEQLRLREIGDGLFTNQRNARPPVSIAECKFVGHILGVDWLAGLLDHCKSVLSKIHCGKPDKPYYIGVCVSPKQRWLDHMRNYEGMSVVIESSCTVALQVEIIFIEACIGDALLVNRCEGGGGLAASHRRNGYVYICYGGNASRMAICKTPKGRRRSGWCSNVLCVGRCEYCCRRWL